MNKASHLNTNTYISTSLVADGRIGLILFNRSEVHNALNEGMIGEIKKAVDAFSGMEKVRIILFRGKGKSFSSGADLNYMKSQARLEMEDNLKDAGQLAGLFRSIYDSPKVTVSAVHGIIAGGANGIVAASDLCMAAPSSRFRFSEVRLGLVPATIAPYVINKAGRAKCRDLFLTGKTFTAAEAEALGIVNRVADWTGDDKELTTFLEELLKGGPEAQSKIKTLFRESEKQLFSNEFINHTIEMIAHTRASAEAREGISAFFEKRNPNWINENI